MGFYMLTTQIGSLDSDKSRYIVKADSLRQAIVFAEKEDLGEVIEAKQLYILGYHDVDNEIE